MLNARHVATRLPTRDLDRARAWYADKLGLEPVETRPGGLRYLIGGGEFVLFASTGQSSGSFTQIAFEVDDLRATVEALRQRGVKFEDYEAPIATRDGIATIQGQYPSKGKGELGAWFRDCEGNLIGVGQPF